MSQKNLLLLCGLILIGALKARSDNKKKTEENDIIKVKAYIMHGALQGLEFKTPIDLKCSTFLQRDDLDSYDVTRYWKQAKGTMLYPMKKTDWPSIDTRTQFLVWHKTGQIDTICLCYAPLLMINSVVYELDSTKYGYPNPYNNFMYLLRSQIAK